MAAIFLQAVHVIGGRLAGDSTPIRRFAPGMELKAPEAVTSDDYGYKGARLIRMAALGLPVPPGFVLPTRFAADISRACNGDWRKGPEAWKHTRLDAELKRHLAYLSRICGERLGDERTPLLLSVRSGAQVTLPGVLGTVLFVGLNDKSVKGLEAQFGALEALRIYARTLLNFAVNVRGLQSERFSAAGPDEKPFAGMDENELRTLIVEYKRIIAEGGRAYPQDPFEQLRESILTVMESPERPDARAFLARHGLDGLRTGVSIQQMVFGSASGMSGSGVSYSCDLYTGADVPSVEFGWNLCGEDYVSGRITPEDTRDWRDLPEDLQDQLAGSAQTLENAFGAPQEIEFTLMRGRLYILQSRDAADALYPLAKARWLIRRTSGDPDATQTVVRMLTMDDVLWMKKALHAPPLKTDLESVIAGKPASPGIGQGFPACTREQALARMRENKPFILVVRRSGLEHQDLIESPWCRGTLELYGSVMSHAASLMRREKNLARPSIVAAPIDLVNDGRTIHLRLDGRLVSDVITLDGNTGKVYLGLCPQQHIPGHEHDADGQDLLKQLENWEHQLRPGMPNPETESPGPLIEGLLRGHIPAGIGAEAARALRRIEDTLPTMLARAKSGDEKSNTTLRNVVAFLVVRDEIVPAIHGTEEEEVQALHLLKAVEGEVLADLAKDDLARFLEAMVDADPELLSAMLRYPDWRHRPYFSWLLRIAQTRPELYTKVLETALIPVGELWPEERKNYAWTTRFLLSSALALADDRAVLDRFVGLRPQTLVSVLAELFCPENGEGEYLDTLGDLSRDDAWRDWSTWGGLAQDALTAWARRAPWKVTAFWNAVEKADQVNRSAWLAPAFRARGIVPGKNRPPLLTPILLGGLTSAGLIVAAVMTGYTATHPAEVIAAGRDSGLVRPEIGYILTAVAAFLLGAGRIGKWFGKIPAWRNWLGEAGSAPTLELEAGRALSERHPRWFRSLEGFIQPGKGLRPWLRPLRLLHGAVAGLLTLALRLYLRRTPAVTPGQERLLNSREQALLVQDVVTALKIDTHAITVRPTSSRKPSSRFFAGSTWGEVDYLDDHLVLWVPDRLLAPSSPFDAILHDYAFFALSQRLRTFLPRWAEDDAGERHRSDSRLAGWSLRASGWLPNGLARLWHRFWLNRAPGMYMEYLHDSMALHSSLSQNLRMEWRDWLPVVLAMRVNADSSGRPFLEHALKWMQQQREHFPAPGNRGRAINHLPINRMWLSLQDFAACMRACPILKSREFGTHGLRLPLELRPFWQGVYHDLLRPFGIRMEREDGTPAAPPRRRLLETGA